MPLVRAVSTSSTGRNEFVRVNPEELNLKDKDKPKEKIKKIIAEDEPMNWPFHQ